MKASSAKTLDLHMLEMDLQSLGSVKGGAESFMRQESRLDLLINNAGVRSHPSTANKPSLHKVIKRKGKHQAR